MGISITQIIIASVLWISIMEAIYIWARSDGSDDPWWADKLKAMILSLFVSGLLYIFGTGIFEGIKWLIEVWTFENFIISFCIVAGIYLLFYINYLISKKMERKREKK